MTRYAIGVDIGATNLKLALIDPDGVVHARTTSATPKDPDPRAVVAGIIAATTDFWRQAQAAGFDVAGFGFGIPHFHEGQDWEQQQTNNMPSLEGFPMRPPLAQAFGSMIAMANDVSAAGIAEHMFGRGRGTERMMMVAIGTGVGTSLITREQGLVHFSWDSIGDAGMIIVDPFGHPDCTCGGRGCLEAHVSGPAIRRRALREIDRGRPTSLADVRRARGDVDARDVSEAAHAGDATARDILEEAGFYLGVAFASFLHIFRPNLLVLGGGVAQAGDLLIEPARRSLARLASPWYLRRLEAIDVAALGKEAAAIGCASLILHPGRYLEADAGPRP
ncbi:MAG: ROK family protein [Actinobacteria bacterium]|nr:ROK family protein [Actinomycetota bacterium]